MNLFRHSQSSHKSTSKAVAKGSEGKPSVQIRMGGVRSELEVGGRVEGIRRSSGVDVVFVFDTTGSMGGFIDGLVAGMSRFIEVLAEKNLDWRMTAVPFGDLYIAGDKVVGNLPWVSNVSGAKSQLQNMPRFSGGGNGGESSFEGLDAALRKKFRDGALKVVILITDDNPHQQEITTSAMSARCVEADALCFAVSYPIQPYSTIVSRTGGELIPITSIFDPNTIIDAFMKVADNVATRSAKVLELGGGSPQRLLEIEGRR